MGKLHIITPVKDSLVTTLKTIDGLMTSEISSGFSYYIYDDFSTEETTQRLNQKSLESGF